MTRSAPLPTAPAVVAAGLACLVWLVQNEKVPSSPQADSASSAVEAAVEVDFELADLSKSIVEGPLKAQLAPPDDSLLTESPQADTSKLAIELPLEVQLRDGEVADWPVTDEVMDVSKMRIETPVETMLAATGETPEATDEQDNPAVEPGLVRWHADFETACAASAQSSRPVLLFHLLGQLDQEFT